MLIACSDPQCTNCRERRSVTRTLLRFLVVHVCYVFCFVTTNNFHLKPYTKWHEKCYMPRWWLRQWPNLFPWHEITAMQRNKKQKKIETEKLMQSTSYIIIYDLLFTPIKCIIYTLLETRIIFISPQCNTFLEFVFTTYIKYL